MGRTALIIGSTGLIGSQLLELLLESKEYSTVIAFVKRDSGIQHPKLKPRFPNRNSKWII